MKKLIYVTLPLFTLVFAGCSSSKITSSWNENNQPAAHFNKILVVGLFDESNRVMRQQMENQLAEELKEKGYNAVTSVSLYGPKSFQNMSEEKALKAVDDNDIDGVITIGLVDKKKEKSYVPGNRYYYPYGGLVYTRWGYLYRPYYIPGFREGHYETNVNYIFETNMYNIKIKKLIYSVQTESYDPSNMNSMADSYSRSVIKDIRKKNVLG